MSTETETAELWALHRLKSALLDVAPFLLHEGQLFKVDELHKAYDAVRVELTAQQERIRALEAARGEVEEMRKALQAIIDRSNNGELGTSKVIDMRNIASSALSTVTAQETAIGRHPYEDSVKAIDFALETDEGIEFLRLWQVGDWQQIDQDWPEFRATVTAQEDREG